MLYGQARTLSGDLFSVRKLHLLDLFLIIWS